jgi:signal transduction histidine kinase/CheY-like chemotaxis protein
VTWPLDYGDYEVGGNPNFDQFSPSSRPPTGSDTIQRSYFKRAASAAGLRIASLHRAARAGEPNAPDETVGRTAWSGLPGLKFELAILLMLIATFLAIRFDEAILSRTITFTPDDVSTYTPYAYSDEDAGGNSRITVDPAQPLAWVCDIRKGVQYPFCNYELLFDGDRATKGIDLTNFETLTLDFSYHGPTDLVRISLKNYDPRYAEPGLRDTAKHNKVDISPKNGRQKVELQMSEFGVAEWWLVYRKIPPELSKPQLDNVVSLDMGPMFTERPGLHRMKVNRITLEGNLFSEAQWYLLILGCWALLMGSFLLHRALTYKIESERRHRQQVEEAERLEAAKVAAESASGAKSEFLANMSHELRTPLNAILGYAQLLQRAQLDEQHALAARTIHRSGSHLLTLITDILDLSRIEAGKLELALAPLDIHGCIEEVGAMMRLKAEEKGLRLSCDIARDLPRYIVSDEKRIRQLLINLAGNAVKFTAEGEVSIRATAPRRSFDSARLRFEVRDTGPGIPADMIDQIFEPFEQIGAAQTRAGGTGLGLSISRQIAALMGGQIMVESTPGEGSRFWFELDVPLFHEGKSSNPAIAPTDVTGRRPRILIVDDLADNRAVLVQTLRPSGFELEEADGAAEAIEASQIRRPDLILMDVKMPAIDGLEAIVRLGSIPSLKDIPVIAVSACATKEVEDESLSAGAVSFLAKPVDEDQLVAMIVGHLGPEWSKPAQVGSAATSAPGNDDAVVAPPHEQMEILHRLAMAGNMRALRTQAREIGAIDPAYQGFADRLEQLARTYQSPAILRLIEQHFDTKRAA